MPKNCYFLVLISLLIISETNWAQTNDPPVIIAMGNQSYCPGTAIKIATSITITDSDDNGIEAMYVQISSGYEQNNDLLTLTGAHPNVVTQWNSSTGKLKLTGVSGGNVLYTDFIAAILDIQFTTSNTSSSNDRYFSITIGDANYLPSSDHFYEFVPVLGITWTSARTAAEGRSYFGLQGYLATITSADEAQLSGEQASGAGWIGGSDAQTEGVWKWVTGPEAGTIFWNGLANGSTPTYANWNNSEPNQAGDEDYAHITAPGIGIPGSWNDLANTGAPSGDYQPKGYIVEYGGTTGDPILNISASISIHIPSITNVISNSRCGDGTVLLEATSDFGVVNWFDAQTNGDLLGIGTTFNTPILNTSTTFYISAAITGCTTGLRTPITATINIIPIIDSTTGETICYGESGTLTATTSNGSGGGTSGGGGGGAPGGGPDPCPDPPCSIPHPPPIGTINWYDVPVGGTSLGTGETFTTPVVNTTTTYYVDASTSNCISPRIAVTLNVQSPTAPTGDSIQYFCKKDNSTISELSTISGINISWYDDSAAGNKYLGTESLFDGQKYYASQNDGICESIDRLEVLVTIYNSVTPLLPSEIPVMEECDTDVDGDDTNNFTIFDLTSYELLLVNGEPESDFTFTYFTDSGYTNLIPNPATFQNTIIKSQTIYVRMTNVLDINCFTDTAFDINVLELPIVNTPSMYSQCDDASNDGIALFNLTLNSIKAEIAPNYISEGLVFTYFNSLNDADNNNNTIASPTNYQNSPDALGLETIWIRVESPNECFRVITFVLEVNPSDAALATYNPSSLFQCDDGADNRDGISTFDLTDIHDHIETVIFPTLNITVHFYENLSDAELENNEIQDIANHQNTNSPIIQDIWVRVKSDLGNDCLGLEDFPSLLNVEALPIANAPSTYIECDDDQDGVFNFVTSNLEADILNGQSLSDVSVTYFDATGAPLQDNDGVLINSPFPNTFLTTSGIINYTLTNNSTNDPNGACIDNNSLEFIVDVLPINNTVIIPPLCDPDPDDGLLIAAFDTSTLESSIGAQPGMEITYFDTAMDPLQDYDGNAIVSPFPNTFITGNQTINIVVTNPINGSCPVNNTIDFVVDELPVFTVESSRIICESGPDSTITLDVYQDDPSEVFNYEWTDESGSAISNDQSLEVTTSGIYSVTLTKTSGSGCYHSEEIKVVYSEKATIDHDDITIVDDSNNNTITINNDNNNLGKGDYEFSLDDEYGPYQDVPFFDYLMPGIHTIYVNDKNGCGVSEIEVSVIGFPKFFTPNNDGVNDTWQILGVNQDFYPSSLIYIYDRFGKILAKINPTSIGWDGYYNGKMLSSDDYWFGALLIDKDGNSRERKGHFSMIRR